MSSAHEDSSYISPHRSQRERNHTSAPESSVSISASADDSLQGGPLRGRRLGCLGVFLALGGLHMPLQVASPGVETPQEHLHDSSCFDDWT